MDLFVFTIINIQFVEPDGVYDVRTKYVMDVDSNTRLTRGKLAKARTQWAYSEG